MPRPRRAFTLHELIVVILIIVVLIAILIPTVHGGHRGSRVVRCASNLRQVGYAILLYGNDNRGAFPRTRASIELAPGVGRVPVWGTGAAATQPFAPDGPAENDVTAGLFLLLRMPTNKLRPIVFICPASTQEVDPLAGDGSQPPLTRSNFTDVKRNLSYSYQNPYPSDSVIASSMGFSSMTVRYAGSYAIVADKNPGPAGGNSLNHDLKGQNILFQDGHVAWSSTPLVGVPPTAGAPPDHIYNTRSGAIIASPSGDVLDNMLLPTD